MSIKNIIIVASFLLSAVGAEAAIYENEFLNLGKSYIKQVGGLPTDDLNSLPSDQRGKCEQRYSPVWNDGVIDIRIVMGYFDWTNGEPIKMNGRDYGYSPSIDPGAFNAVREIMTSRCPGRAEFCEFKQEKGNPYRFTKNVVIHGRQYLARVDMVFSSVTEYLNYNNGKYANEQRARSQSAKNFFNGALQSADAVFYFGHSRNGGGPDFDPPIFVSGTNKVNYNGYYKVHQPGLKNLLSALSGGRKPAILGLMSCSSRNHFLGPIASVAPGTGVISSMDVLEVQGVYTALIGGVDAVLRGQCQKTFYKSLRMTSFNQQYITMDRMFE